MTREEAIILIECSATELVGAMAEAKNVTVESAISDGPATLTRTSATRGLTLENGKKVLTMTPDIWRMLFFILLGVILRLIWDRRC